MDVDFQRVGKQLTISQEIEKQIEKSILNKRFIPGQKLPTEIELCETFGVSRTALREALQMLSSRGLIAVKKGSGIFVEDYSTTNAIRQMRLYLELNLDRDYLKYIVQVRKLLEPDIARLSAGNRTESELDYLQETLVALENCSPYDYKVEGGLDRDFHLAIARSTGNPMIPLIIEPIYQIMPKIKELILEEIDDAIKLALASHKLIYERIREQDEEGAYEAMVNHLEIAEEHAGMIADKL
ncbi:MAG: FadR family transcriptional regulator [Tenericutes bacterium]|nr:FadR family transcriptional regulator [Mycoplasmatota bacterium]